MIDFIEIVYVHACVSYRVAEKLLVAPNTFFTHDGRPIELKPPPGHFLTSKVDTYVAILKQHAEALDSFSLQ